jgi:hypothetical protein
VLSKSRSSYCGVEAIVVSVDGPATAVKFDVGLNISVSSCCEIDSDIVVMDSPTKY